MTLSTLALRGLTHYWRTNIATALGLAVAAAVLAGAVAVGDSVRASLLDLALARLGKTTHAVVSTQFFRAELAPEAPMIAMEAVVTHEPSGRRASKVALYGVDDRFFAFHGSAVKGPGASDVLMSPGLTAELQANKDDQIIVRLPRISAIPMESVQGAKDDPGRSLRGRFREVVPRASAGEFSLRPVQGEVRAVFISLSRMQREFDQRGRVNLALLKAPFDLKAGYQLTDVGLKLRNGRMLESESIVFSDDLAATVKQVDPAATPVLTYLGNSFRANGKEVPYSLIAALDRPDLPDDGSVVLNEWMRKELAAKVGDSVDLDYYLWDPSGRLVTKTASFKVAGFTAVETVDQELAPEYPGISGTATMSDWDPPFPLDLKKIRKQDETYWEQYRATPKAYIRLGAGQKLWRTRYGAVTSFRVSPQFSTAKLRDTLKPEAAGLSVIPAREQALSASGGSTDFGEYFLYFSFFLIISALMLAGLFFRFGLEQRAGEIATLRAVGYSGANLRRLFLTEGILLAVAGGNLGVIGAAAWSGLLLAGLRTWWFDAVGTRDLQLHLTAGSLGLALGSSLIIGPIVILMGLRAVTRKSVRDSGVQKRGRGWLWGSLAAIAGIGVSFIGGAGGFFGAGALLLTGSLLALRWWLRGDPGAVRTIAGLGIRYTAHRPGRSVLCIALIASASFLVVSVDAFRRDPKQGLTGWRFYGETAIPIYHDPNSKSGRDALNLPETGKWLALRLRPGDDASCLNLYAPRNPRVLGVPSSLMVIAPNEAAVDANTLEYVLHRKVGDEIEVGSAKFKITQALPDSLFQSEVIVSDATFQKAFPEEGGFRVFLLDAADGAEGEMETALADYGLDLVTTAARMATFHRVENTWLNTFQALGGLGLVLGTIGLGAILLRNVLERRRELGLLRAVGFRTADLTRMVLAENVFLLGSGLTVGVVCALIAVLPTVLARGGSAPVIPVLGLVLAVAAAGLAASLLAVRVIRKSPLLDSLRSE